MPAEKAGGAQQAVIDFPAPQRAVHENQTRRVRVGLGAFSFYNVLQGLFKITT
jgi:hypothetical protein